MGNYFSRPTVRSEQSKQVFTLGSLTNAGKADQKPRINFFDLPPEIRIKIYSHLFHWPAPIWLPELSRLRPTNRLPQGAPPELVADIRAYEADIVMEYNTFWVRPITDDLRRAIEELPKQFIWRIKHLRFIDETKILTSSDMRGKEYEFWQADDSTGFEQMLERDVDYEYRTPADFDYMLADADVMPNLKTLTVDAGRVEEIFYECWKCDARVDHSCDNEWPCWLDESEAVRNKRYRQLLWDVQMRLSFARLSFARPAPGLIIIINAKVDPDEPITPHKRPRRHRRPVRYTRLELKAPDAEVAAVEERWMPWLYRTAGHSRDLFQVDMKVSTRNITCKEPTGESPEAQGVPKWSGTLFGRHPYRVNIERGEVRWATIGVDRLEH